MSSTLEDSELKGGHPPASKYHGQLHCSPPRVDWLPPNVYCLHYDKNAGVFNNNTSFFDCPCFLVFYLRKISTSWTGFLIILEDIYFFWWLPRSKPYVKTQGHFFLLRTLWTRWFEKCSGGDVYFLWNAMNYITLLLVFWFPIRFFMNIIKKLTKMRCNFFFWALQFLCR